MQFACPECEGSFELSRRAFGTRTDTRTRCAACRTWLIVTRSPDDALIAVTDPDTSVDQQAVAAVRRRAAERALAEKSLAEKSLAEKEFAEKEFAESALTEQTPTEEAGPVPPPGLAPAQRAPASPSRSAGAEPPSMAPTRPPSQSRSQPVARVTAPPRGEVAPATRPSAPGSLQAQMPALPTAELPASEVAATAPFFPSRPQRKSSGFERLQTGADLFALPDPSERLSDNKKRLQMQQVLQDFSMMFRLESKKSNRKQLALTALAALTVVAGLWWALRAKLDYDRRIDAAKDSRKALPAFVLQSAQPEDVAVLSLPGDPTQAAGHSNETWHGTSLSRQLFLRVRAMRATVPSQR